MLLYTLSPDSVANYPMLFTVMSCPCELEAKINFPHSNCLCPAFSHSIWKGNSYSTANITGGVEPTDKHPVSEDLAPPGLVSWVRPRNIEGPDQDHPCPCDPTPTILGKLCGADESGNLKTVLCAVFAGCEDRGVFGCLEFFFFQLCFGPRQSQIVFSIFHFLIITLKGKWVRKTRIWAISLTC